MKNFFNSLKVGILSITNFACYSQPNEEKSLDGKMLKINARITDLEEMIASSNCRNFSQISKIIKMSESLQRDLGVLRSGSVANKAANEELAGLCDRLDKAYSELQTKIQALEILEQEQVSPEIQSVQEKLETLETEIQGYRDSNKQISQENQELREKLEKLESKPTTSEEDHENLENLVQRFNEFLSNGGTQKKQLEDLTKGVQKTKNEVRALKNAQRSASEDVKQRMGTLNESISKIEVDLRDSLKVNDLTASKIQSIQELLEIGDKLTANDGQQVISDAAYKEQLDLNKKLQQELREVQDAIQNLGQTQLLASTDFDFVQKRMETFDNSISRIEGDLKKSLKVSDLADTPEIKVLQISVSQQKQEWQGQLEDVKVKLTANKEKLEQLEIDKKQLEQLSENVKGLHTSYDEYGRSLEEVNKNLENIGKEFKVLGKSVDSLKSDNEKQIENVNEQIILKDISIAKAINTYNKEYNSMSEGLGKMNENIATINDILKELWPLLQKKLGHRIISKGSKEKNTQLDKIKEGIAKLK